VISISETCDAEPKSHNFSISFDSLIWKHSHSLCVILPFIIYNTHVCNYWGRSVTWDESTETHLAFTVAECSWTDRHPKTQCLRPHLLAECKHTNYHHRLHSTTRPKLSCSLTLLQLLMFSTFRAVMLSDNRNSNCLNCKLSHECERLPLQFLHNLEFNSEKRKKPEIEVLNPSVLWRNLYCYRKCIQHVKNCNTTAKKFKFGIIISISSKAVKQNINQKSTASHGIFSCRTFVSLLSHSNTLINFVM